MGTLAIRMPDATHERLKQLARARKVSVNKLIEEFSTAALAEFDAETRFLARAARGSPARGLALLDRLDAAAAAQPRANDTVRARGAKVSKTVKRTRSSR
jgi:predicted transcriptional regulator